MVFKQAYHKVFNIDTGHYEISVSTLTERQHQTTKLSHQIETQYQSWHIEASLLRNTHHEKITWNIDTLTERRHGLKQKFTEDLRSQSNIYNKLCSQQARSKDATLKLQSKNLYYTQIQGGHQIQSKMLS